jgi:hypothetical protein
LVVNLSGQVFCRVFAQRRCGADAPKAAGIAFPEVSEK